MELSLRFSALLPRSESKPFEPNAEAIKRKLLKKGVIPTPKILHAVRKKEIQKSIRRSKKQSIQEQSPPQSDDSALFRTISAEFHAVNDSIERGREKTLTLRGKPWERMSSVDLSGIGGMGEDYSGEKLKGEHLEELREVLEERNGAKFEWLLDDDLEEGGDGVEERRKVVKLNEGIGEEEKVQLLVKRLSKAKLIVEDWKFSRLIKQSGMILTEMHLLKIVEGLGVLGNWRLALSLVDWVYSQRDYKYHKSRFVYTKLLSVLGKARRPMEAYQVFNLMREDGKIYPDMAAYHSIAVTLGQGGFVKELINIIECMRQKPSKKIRNIKRDWDPCLEPDVIIFNAVLNACVPCRQWKGVSWVLNQMRLSGLKPTETSYGLAMEVMMKAGKYDLVHKYFETARRGGLATKSLTYKVLVRTFWEEGKVNEAVEAIRDMERRGIVGTASVYYELACCLCNSGRWQDAMVEVEKLKRLPLAKPLEVTFTGMILASLDGGYTSDCISIFGCMKAHCTPNIGTINAMLKVYRCNDMFAKAKELFESVKDASCGSSANVEDGPLLKSDAFSYSSMLEASASAHQWDYFEYVYKEMALCGYQVDQSKHARLLLEASRAGKWHLLEHAFDTILEAGEIPYTSLFTEMICQTVSRQNFERTIPLVNGMAHASLQVSESRWSDLFRRNKDRFGRDVLQNLLNHMENCRDLVREDPVLNLLKALQSLCGPIQSENVVLLPAPCDASRDNQRLRIQDYLGEGTTFSGNHIDNMNNGIHLQQEGDENGASSLTASGSEDIRESTHGFLTTNVHGSLAELPSAEEILETWKEKRMKDGMFLL